MSNTSQRDTGSGALLAVLGGAISLYTAARYEIGTFSSMGPGMFPLLIGASIGLMGLVIAANAGRPNAEKLGDVDWRPLAAVAAALLTFAATFLFLGAIPAILALTVVASLADDKLTIARAAVYGLFLCGLVYVVFSAVLGTSLDLVRMPF